MKPPEDDAEHNQRNGGAEGKDEIRDDQASDSGHEQPSTAHLVGEHAGRISPECIDDVHHHHDDRYQCDRKPGILGAQDEKCLGEPGQGEDRGDADHDPEAAGQSLRIGDTQSRLGIGFVPDRLTDSEYHHRQGDERRDDRDPEHDTEFAGAEHHQQDRGERPDEGSDGIERLPQPEACAAQVRRREIGDQRVPGSVSHSLADAIDEACGNDPADRAGQRKDRLGEGREAIANGRQQLSLAEPVGQRTREDLGDVR